MYVYTHVYTYVCIYVHRAASGYIHARGYHETRVPGVPLAGCVLRLGRAINCEVLFGKEERGQGGGDEARWGQEELSIVTALPGMHI